MDAAKKFLFDVDFAKVGDGKPAEPVVTLAEHVLKLAEAEAAAQARGYTQAQGDAEVESGRRVAEALERIAAAIGATPSKPVSNARPSRLPSRWRGNLRPH